MEEKRLAQRHAVNGVVQIVAPVQLHLGGGKRLGKNSDELEMTKQTEAAAYRERGQVFGRRVDVSAEVKLIDLSEGDDVDPLNVTAAHLKVVIETWSFFLLRKGEQWI